MATYKGKEIDLTPTEAMAEEAQRFFDWRAEGEKGGTDVAVARARQLVNRQELSADTVRRMHSFFSRHEVDKQAEGFSPNEEGYPSNGRVAWAAWGGDAGQSWARRKDASLDAIDEAEREIDLNADLAHNEANEGAENMSEENKEFDRSLLSFRASDAEMVDEEDRRVRMSLSSEEPVERSFGMEVLGHTSEEIDLSRMNSGSAPLLLDHDMTKQIGVVEETYLDEATRRLRAVVRFGKSTLAREIYDDVKDGIRSNVSIGYQIKNMEEMKDKRGHVRVSQWMPYEASIVAVPADANVGVGRSAKFVEPTIKVKESEMSEINHDQVRAEAAEAAKREFQKNAQEITALGARHNKRDLAEKAIGEGQSVEQFRGLLLDAIGEGQALEQSAGDIKLSAKEQRDYSFMKAVRGLVNGSGLNGLEAEINDEIAMRTGKAARGFYAPDSFWGAKRDLTVGTDSAGGFLKPTDHLGDAFVEALRSRLVMNGLGARFMSGLKGDVAIPKLSGGSAAGFVGEAGSVGEQNPTFSQVTMSPKTLGAFVDVSRLLMIQSDPSVEQIIRDDLLNAMAQKIEDVAIEGGGANEPTGILGTTGIGSVAIGTNGGAATWAKIVDLVKEVEVDNAALNANSVAYLTNSKVKSHLAQTAKVASTDSQMILDAPWNSLYGYDMAVTNNVPSDLTKGTGTALSALIFGDFSQLMIGSFSTADVLIDPYTGSANGNIRIRILQETDVAVRNAESFAAIKDINA